MSAISRRTRVHHVEQTRGSENMEMAGAVLIGVIGLIGGALGAALRSGAKTLPSTRPAVIESVPSVTKMPSPVRLHTPEIALLSRQDREKLTAVLEAGSMPCVVADPPRVQLLAKRLCEARTEEEVHAGRAELNLTLRQGHQQVLAERLTVACRNAAVQTGFQPLATDKTDGGRRMSAVDWAGRLLVTEIQIGNDGNVSLATETVGITDGSCQGVLDSFEEALEREGVRSSSPERKSTGGICELAAAQKAALDWVRRKLVPKPLTKAPDEGRRRKQLASSAQKVLRS